MATDVFDEDGRSVRGRMPQVGIPLENQWSRWPGVWFHGDWASVDADGCWFLHGRADESFNVAGRKVGPAEVEACLLEHPSVSEAAVVGVPDELTGESVVGFVVLKAGQALGDVSGELSAHVARSMGPAFRPRAICAVPELPKGDTSTVENPHALERFRS